MDIYLNGNKYVLRAGTGVTRSPLIDWPENTRLDGQQMRKDRRLLSSWVIDSWVSGLGRQQANVATASDLSSLWDAENVDTRIDGQIVLSPAFNTCTIVPSRGDVDLQFDYEADLYFAESQRALIGAYAYQFSPPFTIGSFRLVGTLTRQGGGASAEAIGSLRAIRSWGNNLGILAYGTQGYTASGAQTSGNQFIRIPTLGGSFTCIPSLPDTLRSIRLHNDPISHFAQLGDLGGTVHLLEYSNVNRMGFWVANQNLGSITSVATLYPVIGTYLAPLVTDGLTMYAQLPEGVYDFDITPSVVIDTSIAKDKNCAQTIFQNRLYFKNKKSLIEYDGTNLNAAGYDQRDGLVSEKMGEITAMASSFARTFAAVQGATYSHILTREIGGRWQYYARVPSPSLWVRDMFLSDSPDAIDRLWIIYGNYGYPGYFLNPLVNPLQAATYSYVPTGHFRPPHYGGDLPEENGAFFDLAFNGDALGGTNSIHILYGLNGANPVSTLGVVSTDNFAITFASPAGVEAYKIQPEFVLTGATSGTTPVFRQAIVHYLKLPEQRQLFDLEVDLEQTAIQETRPLEAVIGSLNYERNLRTLMPFWYGQIATTHVKVIDMPSLEETENGRVYEEERKGTIKLRLAEIL